MPALHACPDVSQFEQLASGALPEAQKEDLLHHIEGCDSCAQKLSTLHVEDTLSDLVRQAQHFEEPGAQETIARLVERLTRLRPSGGQELQPGLDTATGTEKTLAPSEDSPAAAAPVRDDEWETF